MTLAPFSNQKRPLRLLGEEAVETPRREDTSKDVRDFKIDS